MAEHPDRFNDPWHPMTDPVDLKHLGKLLEELGEAVSAAARCIIQGIDKNEPTTGKPNRLWLQEELSDVTAGTILAAKRFNLVREQMTQRADNKMVRLEAWHKDD